jgi:membrane-bound lytic murein transglycosylase B
MSGAALVGCSSSGGDTASPERTTLDPSTTTEPSPTTSSTSTTAPPAPTTTAAPADVFALRPPPPAPDPAALSQQIASAEATIRDPASTEATVAAAALAQQVAYRQLGVHPEWDAEVLAALPAGLRSTVEANAAARRELRAIGHKLSATLPAWRIVAPAPHAELLASYQEAEAVFGIPWRYLAAINLVETATGRIRGTSTAGAQGPMQFMPATWAAYGAGGDIDDPHDAIMGAARYLAANNGAVDIDHALFRYNHSQHYVRGVRLYADLIAQSPQSALAYYHWGVWYVTDHGEAYLPVGYPDQPAIAKPAD